MKNLSCIIKFWYFLQVLNWCYREPSFILFFKLSSVWDGCRLMMCLFSVGPFGDILMVRVKVLKKLKIRPDGDEIFQKKLTGDEKSAINPELSCRAIVSKHLRFVNQNFDPNFFWNFRQKMSSSTLILKKQPIPIDEESIFDIHLPKLG